jgi:hypothetical protein
MSPPGSARSSLLRPVRTGKLGDWPLQNAATVVMPEVVSILWADVEKPVQASRVNTPAVNNLDVMGNLILKKARIVSGGKTTLFQHYKQFRSGTGQRAEFAHFFQK